MISSLGFLLVAASLSARFSFAQDSSRTGAAATPVVSAHSASSSSNAGPTESAFTATSGPPPFTFAYDTAAGTSSSSSFAPAPTPLGNVTCAFPAGGAMFSLDIGPYIALTYACPGGGGATIRGSDETNRSVMTWIVSVLPDPQAEHRLMSNLELYDMLKGPKWNRFDVTGQTVIKREMMWLMYNASEAPKMVPTLYLQWSQALPNRTADKVVVNKVASSGFWVCLPFRKSGGMGMKPIG